MLVPVDVRVLDASGNAIKGLTASDFEILEDGVVQRIALFTTYDAATVASAGEGGVVTRQATIGNRRTFLIALGRGDLEGPARGLTALAEFVRTKLLPGDRVGVLAYKRVTDLTTDRAGIVRLLQHFQQRYRPIENRLVQWFIAEDVREQIDALFAAPELLPTRELPHRFPPSDLGQFFLAVDHLRYYEGEKHLIFISEATLAGRMMEGMARAAADARIAVSIIRTGGSLGRMRQPSGARGGQVSFSARSFNRLWNEQDTRRVAEHTGGQSFLYQYASEALSAIERASRIRYLVGYYPTRYTADDYRRIEVRVRRGATVLYRHGYRAHPDVPPLDHRQLITHARIMAAAATLRPPRDIGIKGEARVDDTDGRSEVQLDLEVQMTNVAFSSDGERRLASLDIATFVADGKQNLVGELWQQVAVRRDPDVPSRRPLGHHAAIRTRGQPRYVKVVVYDSSGDRLGVIVIDLRKK